MTTGFDQAAAGTAVSGTKLTFVSDFDKTINLPGLQTNWEVLRLMTDAKAAGHRAIFTSSRIGSARNGVELCADFSEMFAGFKFDPKAFEYISKDDLRSDANFRADYIFDDEPVDYAKGRHLRVLPDGSTKPLSVDQIRVIANLPIAATGAVPADPAP